MEEFGGLGLMHRLRVNDQVKVLESYLAPTDFTIGELTVRKGTWMLAVRVLSDELWDRVKSGDLTGFSIGGSARRVPEPAPAPAPPPRRPTPSRRRRPHDEPDHKAAERRRRRAPAHRHGRRGGLPRRPRRQQAPLSHREEG
jgi:hypothetical protein